MRWAVLPLLLLTGCQSAAERQARLDDSCTRGFTALGDPKVDPVQKQAILETMRNAGCMGRQPEERVRLDVRRSEPFTVKPF